MSDIEQAQHQHGSSSSRPSDVGSRLDRIESILQHVHKSLHANEERMESIETTLQHLHEMLHAQAERLHRIERNSEQVKAKLDAIIEFLIPGKATDLEIVFGEKPANSAKGKEEMANKKATGAAIKLACFGPKKPGGAAAAVMPPVVFTDPLPKSVTLQNKDASGGNVAIGSGDSVTGTLVSDNPAFTVVAGADSLHYTATVAAQTPFGTTLNLTATETGTIQGAPANFNASVQVTLNIAPAPTAIDLEIIFG